MTPMHDEHARDQCNATVDEDNVKMTSPAQGLSAVYRIVRPCSRRRVVHHAITSNKSAGPATPVANAARRSRRPARGAATVHRPSTPDRSHPTVLTPGSVSSTQLFPGELATRTAPSAADTKSYNAGCNPIVWK